MATLTTSQMCSHSSMPEASKDASSLPPRQSSNTGCWTLTKSISFSLLQPDACDLLDQVFSSLPEFASEYEIKPKDAYFAAAAEEHRYDTRETVMLKRLLQRELPPAVRSEIVRRLFARYVTCDEATFACELYMSIEQVACLRRHGMQVGSHGYAHTWLNHLSPEEQAADIDRSLGFSRRSAYIVTSGPCVIPTAVSTSRCSKSCAAAAVS